MSHRITTVPTDEFLGDASINNLIFTKLKEVHARVHALVPPPLHASAARLGQPGTRGRRVPCTNGDRDGAHACGTWRPDVT